MSGLLKSAITEYGDAGFSHLKKFCEIYDGQLAELRSTQDSNQALSNKNISLQSQLDKVKQENAQMKIAIVNLRQDDKRKAELIKQFEENEVSLHADIKSLNAAFLEQKRENREACEELKKTSSNYEWVLNANALLQEQKDTLAQACKRSETECESVKRLNEELERKVKEISEIVKSLKGELRGKKAAFVLLQSENEMLEAKKDELSQSLDEEREIRRKIVEEERQHRNHGTLYQLLLEEDMSTSRSTEQHVQLRNNGNQGGTTDNRKTLPPSKKRKHPSNSSSTDST